MRRKLPQFSGAMQKAVALITAVAGIITATRPPKSGPPTLPLPQTESPSGALTTRHSAGQRTGSNQDSR